MELNVLVVDDEDEILEVLQDRLEAYGFRVTTAPDGIRALEKLSDARFDGVFLDLKMPEMDGVETLKRIRKSSSEIPVINNCLCT